MRSRIDCASRCRLWVCCLRIRSRPFMKKREVDHVLRAAGRITHETQFIIVGSQALHGKYPDIADDIERSVEVDLFAKDHPEKTGSLNAIGVFSPFHEAYGYYADPVDENT